MSKPIVFFDVVAEGPGGAEPIGRIEMEVRHAAMGGHYRGETLC
jgi:hypothetical protein